MLAASAIINAGKVRCVGMMLSFTFFAITVIVPSTLIQCTVTVMITAEAMGPLVEKLVAGGSK